MQVCIARLTSFINDFLDLLWWEVLATGIDRTIFSWLIFFLIRIFSRRFRRWLSCHIRLCDRTCFFANQTVKIWYPQFTIRQCRLTLIDDWGRSRWFFYCWLRSFLIKGNRRLTLVWLSWNCRWRAVCSRWRISCYNIRASKNPMSTEAAPTAYLRIA